MRNRNMGKKEESDRPIAPSVGFDGLREKLNEREEDNAWEPNGVRGSRRVAEEILPSILERNGEEIHHRTEENTAISRNDNLDVVGLDLTQDEMEGAHIPEMEPELGIGGDIIATTEDLAEHVSDRMGISNSGWGDLVSAGGQYIYQVLTVGGDSQTHNHSDEVYLARALTILGKLAIGNGRRRIMENTVVDMIGGERGLRTRLEFARLIGRFRESQNVWKNRTYSGNDATGEWDGNKENGLIDNYDLRDNYESEKTSMISGWWRNMGF